MLHTALERRKLTIQSEAGPSKATAAFLVEPSNGGTRLRFTIELQFKGALRLLEGIARGRVASESDADFERLKQQLER